MLQPIRRWLVPRDGSPLRDRKRLAAVTTPQIQVMIGGQDDGKGVLVAIEAAEPLENRLELPRLLRSKVHAASLLDSETAVLWSIRTKYTPVARRAQHRLSQRSQSAELRLAQLESARARRPEEDEHIVVNGCLTGDGGRCGGCRLGVRAGGAGSCARFGRRSRYTSSAAPQAAGVRGVSAWADRGACLHVRGTRRAALWHAPLVVTGTAA
jgi:hypothetical protein